MNRLQMETEVLAQAQVAKNSSLFPSTRLTQLVQSAYARATDLFPWTVLAKGKTTSTVVKGALDDVSYYDYPSEFKTGSIFLIKIDGKSYYRKSYMSFMMYREKYPSSQVNRFFTEQERFFFITPDTSAGTNNMDIWGIVQVPELSAPTTETVFAGNATEVEYAIIRLAVSMGFRKIDNKFSQSEEASAIATLARINKSEWAKFSLDQQVDLPMFYVPNFMSGGNQNLNIGNFNGNFLEGH